MSKKRMLLALDIETKSITSDSEDALIPHKSEITCIGVWSLGFSKVYRAPWKEFLSEVYNNDDYEFVMHNGKFDLKHMENKFGPMFNWRERYAADTRYMAFVSTTKIPEHWLTEYDDKRKLLNETRKMKHREARQHSLKTLAPYFLNVEPFWEPDEGHDNDEYVLKDCEYTFKLYKYLLDNMTDAERIFCENKLMPWAKMILEAEMRGVCLDLDTIVSLEHTNEQEIAQLTASLKQEWHEHFGAYSNLVMSKLNTKYNEMFQQAAAKHPNKSLVDLQLKYVNLFEAAKRKAIESGETELSLDSPAQLKWLLSERLGLDVTNLEGDESTGKEVLQRLAIENKSVDKLLRLRKLTKLNTAFFPKYKSLVLDGKIHAEFNIDGTRTGRLSSSRPNLQQHPRDLKQLFRARPGHKLITYDLQSIEPVLMAYFTGDETLVDIVVNNRNFHSLNTRLMFSLDCNEEEVKNKYKHLRDIAKEIFLSLLYGAGWRQVQMSCLKRGIVKSERECKEVVKLAREKYKGVWSFKQDLDAEMEKGTVIYNLMGRPMKIENPDEVYLKAFNTLIQGSASDLVLDIAYEIEQSTDSSPLMFIHDSVVVEVPEELATANDWKVQKIFKRTLTDGALSFTLNIEGGVADEWI